MIFVNDGSRDRSAALLQGPVPARGPTSRASSCSTPTTASTWRSSPASSGAAASASSRSTPTCRIRRRKSRKLLAAMDAGHDYVGGVRRIARGFVVAPLGVEGDEPPARAHHPHQDDRPGLHAARLQPRHRATRSLRAREVSTFIPALAYTFAHNPTEVEVAHEERAAGESKYSLYKLIRLNFDLDHRLFAGAAAAVLDVRHARLGGRAGHLPRRHRRTPGALRLARRTGRRSGTATSSRSS